MKVVTVVGTRPEVIKMAPVIHALNARPDRFKQIVVATAQHREMLDQVLDVFEIRPHVDLDVMSHAPSLGEVAGNVLVETTRVFSDVQPDIVLVQGDTTTVLATSLSCFYAGVAVGHVEAGLRSNDLHSPYPEELNRRATALATTVHFAPTARARMNLLDEGVDPGWIYLTGNTIVDAVAMLDLDGELRDPVLREVDFSGSRVLLVTAHRRESHGPALRAICRALRAVVRRFEDVEVVFPVHLNPIVRAIVRAELDSTPRIHLTEPLPYDEMLRAMSRSYLILTDSGGIQEEGPSLRKPVLVLREVTERPELVETGAGVLVGTQIENIVAETTHLLEDAAAYEAMVGVPNPFGDGLAAKRIVDILSSFARVEQTEAALPETRDSGSLFRA